MSDIRVELSDFFQSDPIEIIRQFIVIDCDHQSQPITSTLDRLEEFFTTGLNEIRRIKTGPTSSDQRKNNYAIIPAVTPNKDSDSTIEQDTTPYTDDSRIEESSRHHDDDDYSSLIASVLTNSNELSSLAPDDEEWLDQDEGSHNSDGNETVVQACIEFAMEQSDERNTTDDEDTNPGSRFKVDDQVVVLETTGQYEAVVQDIRPSTTSISRFKHEYLVQFKDWPDEWDQWRPESDLLVRDEISLAQVEFTRRNIKITPFRKKRIIPAIKGKNDRSRCCSKQQRKAASAYGIKHRAKVVNRSKRATSKASGYGATSIDTVGAANQSNQSTREKSDDISLQRSIRDKRAELNHLNRSANLDVAIENTPPSTSSRQTSMYEYLTKTFKGAKNRPKRKKQNSHIDSDSDGERDDEERLPKVAKVSNGRLSKAGSCSVTSTETNQTANQVIQSTQEPSNNTSLERSIGRTTANQVTQSTQEPSNNASLERSIGRTRAELNELDRSPNLNLLKENTGMFAKFALPTIATKDGKVSHLVMNDEWNVLASSQDEIQEFYLGMGAGRARQGNLLAAVGSRGIPLFHAPKKAERTTKIYYVGHWAPIKADTKYFEEGKNVMGEPRQMLIRLRFDWYDYRIDRMMREGTLFL